MRVEILDNFRDFFSMEDEWNDLFARSNHNCVSLTHEWLRCWCEAFGNDMKLHVLTVRDGGRLGGAIPLMFTRDRLRRLPVRKLKLMVNGHTPEGGILAAEPEADFVNEILGYLHETRDKWDVLTLPKLPRALAITNGLEDRLRDHGFSCILSDSSCSPCIDMRGDWESYYASRSKKFRKVMRNKLNRVERDGSFTTERISDLDAIRSTLDEIFEVSSKSWKAGEGRSIPDDPRVETFYRRLTDVMGEKEMVELWLMRHGKEAIAFEYHLKCEGIAYPIRADFDEDYRHISPGSVLEYQIIKTLFENPKVNGYNSCGHTYDYLMKWATQTREYVDFQIFSSQAYSGNLFFLESKVVPMARKAKELLKNHKVGVSE